MITKCIQDYIFSPQAGKSPLHIAAENCSIIAINTLITHGANAESKDMVRKLIILYLISLRVDI